MPRVRPSNVLLLSWRSLLALSWSGAGGNDRGSFSEVKVPPEMILGAGKVNVGNGWKADVAPRSGSP
jgi:hypothetical protein